MYVYEKIDSDIVLLLSLNIYSYYIVAFDYYDGMYVWLYIYTGCSLTHGTNFDSFCIKTPKKHFFKNNEMPKNASLSNH